MKQLLNTVCLRLSGKGGEVSSIIRLGTQSVARFGPAVQVFTEAWPLPRGTARPAQSKNQEDLFEEFDPYAHRPEHALEAARRAVK